MCDEFGVDRSRPIVTQVSRFDRAKDPVGVVQAFKQARKYVDCQLVLAGGGASDDPEGAVVLKEVKEAAGEDPDIIILDLPPWCALEINALQRASTLIVQKSIREGFGLTVTEALWKGKPTIAGAVGGIPNQIIHKLTGVLGAFRRRLRLSDALSLDPSGFRQATRPERARAREGKFPDDDQCPALAAAVSNLARKRIIVILDSRLRSRIPVAVPVTILRNRRTRFSLNGNFHLSALLQADFVSVLVCQSVLDANLSVEVIGPFHGDLGLLGFTGSRNLIIFSTIAGRVALALLIAGSLLIVS